MINENSVVHGKTLAVGLALALGAETLHQQLAPDKLNPNRWHTVEVEIGGNSAPTIEIACSGTQTATEQYRWSGTGWNCR